MVEGSDVCRFVGLAYDGFITEGETKRERQVSLSLSHTLTREKGGGEESAGCERGEDWEWGSFRQREGTYHILTTTRRAMPCCDAEGFFGGAPE